MKTTYHVELVGAGVGGMDLWEREGSRNEQKRLSSKDQKRGEEACGVVTAGVLGRSLLRSAIDALQGGEVEVEAGGKSGSGAPAPRTRTLKCCAEASRSRSGRSSLIRLHYPIGFR